MDKKIERMKRRKKSIRKKVHGTAERPRMCVFKSNRNISIQLINDVDGKTLCGMSTLSKELAVKDEVYTRKNSKFASLIGEQIAKKAKEMGISTVTFDRSGYRYHGVIKFLAEAARKGGLQF
ncbi:MAG: 50S ribosomal protein L18 [Candidatus Omnitrophota bacterium]